MITIATVNDKITALFCEMSGLSKEEAAGKEELFSLAKQGVSEMLSDLADIDEDIAEINYLVAASAFYKLSLLQKSGGEATIKVGDVSVSRSEKSDNKAAEIFSDAKTGAKKYLKDEGFFFGGVC